MQASILLHVAWEKSDTADETRYVSSAASLFANGATRDLCEAPALPKRAFGLALRIAEPAVSRSPLGWQPTAEQLIVGKPASTLRRLFFAARCATVAAVVVAGWFVRATAIRFGRPAALLAHGFWCFSPTLLANGSLATLDAWAASLMAVVLWASVRLVERPSYSACVLAGIACGAALATKATTLVAVPIAPAILSWHALRRRAWPRPARAWAARVGPFACASAGVLWLLYGASFGGVDVHDPCPLAIDAAPTIAGWLPFPAWIEGLLFQLRHGRQGHASYLFGEVRMDGWWWFYLACLALKVPLGTQLTAVCGAVLAVVDALRARSGLAVDLALLAFPATLLVAMSLGRHQANIAFLLPALPFVCVWLGRSADRVARALGPGGVVVATVVVASATEAVGVHPHYLVFFNAWAGGPEGGPRYLVHREDWGQDKRLLAEWQRERGIERLYYAPYGPNATEWGIVFDPVPCEPTPGVYALHAVEVHRPLFGLRPGCVDWLTVEPPDERLGYSIYVYSVDRERIARLAMRRGAPPFWSRPP